MRLVVLGALGALILSVAGVLAMTGALRHLASSDLSAEVRLVNFPLPQGFGLEPELVAGFLTEELTNRASDDIALRMALGSEGQTKLIEVAIPRLVNSVVVRDMITRIRPLHNVLSVGAFRLAGQVTVTNQAKARKDVALTLPGLLLAEGAGIETTGSGLTALTLGDMAPGEARSVQVWLGEGAMGAGPGFGSQVLLGDAAGVRGRVWIYGPQGGWAGSDLQAIPLARWVVGGVLAIVALASALVLVMALMTRLKLGARPRREAASLA